MSDADLENGQWGIERFTETRCQILVTGWCTPPLPQALIEHPDFSIRYICNVTGSVRKCVPRQFLERGGILTNWGGIAAPYVAEHALLLALAALRNQSAWRTGVDLSEQCGITANDHILTRTLFGRRVGLHGYGRIARALINLLRPFKVEIFAFSSGVPYHVMEADGTKPCGSLHELFKNSEVLFECEALTPGSEQSVSRQVLAALPDQAVFVNVGRGLLVDEAALLEAARRGRIRVALDVMSSEPLRSSSEFYKVANTILSPHIGGPTRDRYEECGALALENIHSFLKGESMKNLVTLEDYDRST